MTRRQSLRALAKSSLTATIRRVRELDAVATQGPWFLCPGSALVVSGHEHGPDVAECEPDGATPQQMPACKQNADLISEVERLTARVAVLEAALKARDVCWHCGDELAPQSKPRCERCPRECDIDGCEELGCEAK